MFGARFMRVSGVGVLCVWAGISLLALVMMYELWWSRERVAYGGKDRMEQIAGVCDYAGIHYANLEAFFEQTHDWGAREVYQVAGDHNQLSYVKYLLAPHVSGESDLTVTLTNKVLLIEGGGGRSGSDPPHVYDNTRSVWAWLSALLIVAGIGLGIRESARRVDLSTPEALALSVGCVAACVLFSKGLSGSAESGCWVALVAGILGWNLFTQAMIRKGVGIGNLFRRPSGKVWLLGGFSVLVLLWTLLMAVIVVPDDWDAWAIWGPKAKVLLGAGPLSDVQYFGHADYPLLWPSVWAFTGWLNQGWEEYFVRGWGAVFLGLTAWQCDSALPESPFENNTQAATQPTLKASASGVDKSTRRALSRLPRPIPATMRSALNHAHTDRVLS